MLRIATLLLCILLTAAAAGRYQAEVSVREAREEIKKLEQEKIDEARRIQVLRAELAWLESPDRLAKIAREKTELEPLTGKQLISSAQFVSALSSTAPNALHFNVPNTQVSQNTVSQSKVSDQTNPQ